jgi:hypothetical protein
MPLAEAPKHLWEYFLSELHHILNDLWQLYTGLCLLLGLLRLLKHKAHVVSMRFVVV